MDDFFLGTILPWGPVWAPRNWALCNGQLLPISTNTALFSLIGTLYGGDGRTTFALPDLRGRAIIGAGNGPGLTSRTVGEMGGLESVTLNISEMPSHNHPLVTSNMSASLQASSQNATSDAPENGSVLAKIVDGSGLKTSAYKSGVAGDVDLAGGVISGNMQIGNSGGNLGHENMQPFTATSYIIALVGIYPSRG